MIKREHYLEQIRPFYDDDLIKIIVGIRRCGKSVILDQIKAEIRKYSNNIIYLNFEDAMVSSRINGVADLINYVNENRTEGKCYLFFDEIQMLEGWSEACKSLRLSNNSVFITGSNSKLLSREFTKELSGRFVSFRIRPFVYRELLEYSHELGRDIGLSDYLVWGGFPKRIEYPTEVAQRAYLNDLDQTIVINDLINRYRIRNEDLFKKFTNYVLLSNARIFSARSINKYVNDNYGKCSLTTIIRYLSYLEEAFVIDSIKQYSSRTKKELLYYQKVYDADVAFNSLRCVNNRYDLTHNFENIIFNELLYMGYSCKVFDNDGKEIDFIASKDGKVYFIQAAYSIAEEKTYDREFAAFKTLDNLNQKIIITNDDLDYSTSTIKHLKFKDFVLMKSLDEK